MSNMFQCWFFQKIIFLLRLCPQNIGIFHNSVIWIQFFSLRSCFRLNLILKGRILPFSLLCDKGQRSNAELNHRHLNLQDWWCHHQDASTLGAQWTFRFLKERRRETPENNLPVVLMVHTPSTIQRRVESSHLKNQNRPWELQNFPGEQWLQPNTRCHLTWTTREGGCSPLTSAVRRSKVKTESGLESLMINEWFMSRVLW